MRLIDVQVPFFIPLWRRIAVVVLCLGWAIVEVTGGNTGWAIVFAAMGLFCAYEFFVAFDPKGPEDDDT